MDIFEGVNTESIGNCPNDVTAGISTRIYYATADSFQNITLPNSSAYESSVVITPENIVFHTNFGWSHLDCLIDENELKSALSSARKKSITNLEIFALGLDAKKLGFIELLKNSPLVFLVPDTGGNYWLVGNLRNRAFIEKADTTSARRYEDNPGTAFTITSKSQLFRYGGTIQQVNDTKEVIDITGLPFSGNYPSGKIYLVDAEPTGADLNRFSKPVIFRILSEGSTSDITYDAEGNRFTAEIPEIDTSTLANTNASNISEVNAELWRNKLNVPQIPDSVISKGEVTADSSTVYLALSVSGKNEVLIGGQTYERTDPQSFPFTPVTTGEKILIIYALPDSQVFHLAQGAESTEAVEPTYSGLFVARLLVTAAGIDIVEAVSGFREKTVDNFAIYSLAAGDIVIGIGAEMRLRVQSSGAIRIGGFENVDDQLYNGCPISVRNDTPFPIEFYNAVDTSPEFIAINSADLPFSIKPGETANFAYRGLGIVEIIKTGGSASFPETGNDGDVLEKDSTADGGVKWSNRMTDLEVHQIVINTSASITTDTVGSVTGKSQHGRNVRINNGVNAINITCETSSNADFVASYTKLGSGAITFVAGSGATLVQVDGSAILNGAVGSTACLTRSGNTFYLQISNR